MVTGMVGPDAVRMSGSKLSFSPVESETKEKPIRERLAARAVTEHKIGGVLLWSEQQQRTRTSTSLSCTISVWKKL
jgi:hypothetical protein